MLFAANFGRHACAARVWPMSPEKPLCEAAICCQTEGNEQDQEQRNGEFAEMKITTMLGVLALSAAGPACQL